ncbi:hypothetical protein AXG93_215s1100 [Marchantia polymorpha subsp. ruderalis]|uniref:Uncharacterized protein n=1 Tax=Marchantia polymorpha subsp. ruderalis TaxID=1480154 RepID=A0A176W2H7_MARPO|nr:hypothetical protein AXG93_215s1100 [Marchantia polymorpha subsp. ruderalis]
MGEEAGKGVESVISRSSDSYATVLYRHFGRSNKVMIAESNLLTVLRFEAAAVLHALASRSELSVRRTPLLLSQIKSAQIPRQIFTFHS